ncbi:MAG: Flp pilus assembly complex ATPase component TadA [Phycisphaerales bacterium]|nr:Flp pilus assembly complex ATPase component TadA [Phycisphaerales bacterium]
MARMTLRPANWQGQHVKVELDPISIGRHPDNTIPIHDDKASRFHCVIEPEDGGGFRLRDLGSRNGTRVNEAKVEDSPLRNGDTVRVGDHEFTVEITSEAAPKAAARTRKKAQPGSPFTPRAGEPDWVGELNRVIESLPPRDERETTITIIDAAGKPSEALGGDAEGPLAVRLLLELSSKSRATDIHMEPKGELTQVRLRVDGQMVTVVELPARVGNLVSGLIKTACQMGQAARDAVQEGHFSARYPDRRVEFRVSFTPSVHGQKLVMRVLDQREIPRALDELGLIPWMYQRVRRTCEQDHGLLLVCGPTGSGKTTTLYNALRHIDRHAKNVVTIEDPVEYQLDNVTQIPIDEARGNNFNQLLRSVLRQDPDVILVGEVRDEDTARTAMQAAMTGHLVFSTVHAKDTIASVFRLLDLKVEPYLVASSLEIVLAQRLVRTLCEGCKRPVAVAPGQATRLGRFLGGKTQVYTATGCARCLRTGFRGRRAIFELLDFNDELRDIILRDPSIQAMKKIIDQGHFTTLAQSGWRLVAEGVTTLEEVDQVAGQG